MAEFVDIKEVGELESYIARSSLRSGSLQKFVQDLEDSQARVEADFGKFRKSALSDVAELKADVAFLKSSVTDIHKLIIAMIGQMKNTLKKADYDRFEKRLDAWAPENLVNRKEAGKIIRQARINP